MNIVAILASGVGNRFGSNVPKQFHKVSSKMVIEYVIEAVVKSANTDKIIIVTDVKSALPYLENICDKNEIDLVQGGVTRNESLGNVIDYIGENFKCENLIVCDAVRPLISAELLDKYYDYLDSYNAVVTAQKITDSLGSFDSHQVDRSRYYLMQSPEGFNFELLLNSFDRNSLLTEVAQHLPENSKIKLYFDFTNNIKLTYPADLKYLEALINAKENKVDSKIIIDSVTRLNDFLRENYPNESKNWVIKLQSDLTKLLKKWQITDYEINYTSHFGIIMYASSVKYGDCVMKIIPPFINRYLQERACYQNLNHSVMCELYDYDDGCSAILMERLDKEILGDFESNSNLFLNFFEKQLKLSKSSQITVEQENLFSDYYLLLKSKCSESNFDYKNEEIMDYVQKAVTVFEENLTNEKKSLIHGDLHRYNILMKENNFFAIDPIGYIAPPVIDIARFVGTELTDNFDNAEKLYLILIEKFSTVVDRKILECAVFTDIVFRLHNSIFENSSFDLTDKWLKILEKIK